MRRKECDHQEYMLGKALCHYLLANTSTEFPIINFKASLGLSGKFTTVK
ncbi:MAG: hypothetical protein ACEQSE_04570 [Candidatus Aquirickettsiella gammari]